MASPLAKPWTREDDEPRSETKDNWCTPPEVKDALLEFTRGRRIALDPCSNENSIIDAKVEWYGPHAGGTDGLVVPWTLLGPDDLAYVNNPFSQNHAWARKCAGEGMHTRGHIINLIPCDTSTVWFHEYLVPAPARCFWKGRLTFHGDRAYPATFPVLLTYWGLEIGHFRGVFGKRGWCP